MVCKKITRRIQLRTSPPCIFVPDRKGSLNRSSQILAAASCSCCLSAVVCPQQPLPKTRILFLFDTIANINFNEHHLQEGKTFSTCGKTTNNSHLTCLEITGWKRKRDTSVISCKNFSSPSTASIKHDEQPEGQHTNTPLCCF